MNLKLSLLAFLLATFSASLSGCANLAAASAGQIGCPTGEIQISDDNSDYMGGRNWVATCRGRRFFCNVVKTNRYTSVISCAPEVPPVH